MEHKGTVVIETKRLLLRRFNMDDIEFAFKNWTSDEKVTEFLRWPTHKDITITQRVLEDWIDNYKNENYYQWAIELKEISEPIGSISVVDMDDKTDKVHIGYAIGSNWWNQGITSEAFFCFFSFLFDDVKVILLDEKKTETDK